MKVVPKRDAASFIKTAIFTQGEDYYERKITCHFNRRRFGWS